MLTEPFVNKGLNFDTHENLLPDNSLVYLLNGDITGFENSGNGTFVQNALSNAECFKFPFGYELLASVPLDKGQFALFFKTPTSSEIGLFDSNTCAYVPRVNDPCLNFTKKINGRFKTKQGCDLRRVYYVDGTTQLRFIDIDECLPVKNLNDCHNCEENLTFDCEAFNANRCVKFPKLKLTEGVGNLPNGSYQIAIALTDYKQRFTEYHIYPEVLKFHSNNQANNRFGIGIEFLTCPEGYDEYELVLITHRSDRGTQASRIGYFGSNQDSNFISELDDASYVPLDISTLLRQFPRYVSADHIATNDEILILGGVKYRDPINYQPQANQIKSNWVVKQVPAKEAHLHYNYMRGEVYAHFIRGIYCDGERTERFHIPSDSERKIRERDPVYWDLIQSEAPEGPDYFEKGDNCDPSVKKYWELYDTSFTTEGASPDTDPELNPTCVKIQFGVLNHFQGSCDAENPSIQFEGIYHYFEIFALNGYCQEAVVSEDIEVQVLYEYSNCGGSTQQEVLTHVLQAGQSHFIYPFVNYQLEDCGTGSCLPLVRNIVSIVSVSGNLPVCTGEEDCLRNCDGTITQKGDFAHWESQLKYPNNPCVWGQRNPELPYYQEYGLACQNVRYHKFPENCQTHIHSKASCNGEEFIYILGIEFTNIPPFLDKNGDPIPDIVGYEIEVADRTNQKSILHKGLISNMWEEALPDCTPSYYANYPFNDLRPDVFLSKTKAKYQPPFQYGETGFNPPTEYSRNKFQYISPDVSYERNDSGSYLQVYSEENGYLTGEFSETFDHTKSVILSDAAYLAVALTFTAALIGLAAPLANAVQAAVTALNSLLNGLPKVNYALNYFAKSAYNNFNCANVQIGNIRRRINLSQYLLPSKILVGEHKINNLQRESGLFLDLSSDILDPSVTEYSRVRVSDNDCQATFGPCAVLNGTRTGTSSYYAGVKVYKPNQYGLPDSNQVRTILRVDWNNQGTSETGPIYGGDVYITKHKYIKKFPFFTTVPIGLPNGLHYDTSPYFNVWNTRYWMDFDQQATFYEVNVFGAFSNDSRNLDRVRKIIKGNCDQGTSGDCGGNLVFRVDGKYYTHVVSESQFWCESEYISDFREVNEIPESDIERSNKLKALYRTVELPELFLYNRQYHYKGLSNYSSHFDPDYDCCKPPVICSKNTIAYSLKHDPLSKGDAWLKFLPDSIQQFSQKDGNLVGMKETGDYNLMVFFENATYVTQQDDSLITENGRIYLGSPSAFERRMRKISDEATGLGGCIDLDSVVNTPYGPFWFDRPRRKFVHLGRGVTDVSKNINSWLQKYLPETEEIMGVYDNFTDNLYFTGKGKNNWTLSYKPKLEDWVSFHSFIPDSYLQLPNNFISANDKGLWKHNHLYDYQTYYGVKHPFDVGFVVKDGLKPIILSDMSFYVEWIRNKDFNSKIYENKFFNKILVYNQFKSTGVREIQIKDLNNVNHYGFQNRTDLIECTNLEDGLYRVNKFTAYQLNQPFVTGLCMDYAPSTEVKEPTSNTGHQANMRGKWFRVHLISDNETMYKILLQLNFTANEEIKQ